MLTKEDKEFLKENFMTEAKLAKELKPIRDSIDLLRASDIRMEEKIEKVSADVTNLKTDVADLKVDSALLQQTVQRLEKGLEESIELSRQVLTTVQGFAGNVADLEQENKFGAVILSRHDVQIHELALATGTVISE